MAASGLAAPPLAAQTVEARLGDLRLATAVRIALARDAATRALDVDVSAQNGAVRLSPSSVDALRVARGVAGVQSIDGAGVSSQASTAPERPTGPPPDASSRETTRAASAPAGETAPRASAWGTAPRAEAPAPSRPAGPAVHVVGRGETLFSLARRYSTTVDALRRLNGLTATAGIEIGQRLRLR